jgi:hypothetical protein
VIIVAAVLTWIASAVGCGMLSYTLIAGMFTPYRIWHKVGRRPSPFYLHLYLTFTSNLCLHPAFTFAFAFAISTNMTSPSSSP